MNVDQHAHEQKHANVHPTDPRKLYGLLLNYAYAGMLAVSFLCMSSSGMLGHEDHVALRFVVTAAGLFGVYAAAKARRFVWLGLLAVLVAIFNPIWHPHGLGREVWMAMDAFAALAFTASIFFGLRPSFK
jgi:hypothetical protein